MTNNSAHLTVSLEEFGLSRYEAKSYVTLISRGPMSASDLAYYSEIPRTKIYSTMSKLESKGLATTSKGKPVMCTAIPPEDAFDTIIHEQIQKVTTMNTLVADLKKASDESRRSRNSEEKRYVQIGAGSVLGQMRTMIDGAESSVMVVVDQFGLGLLVECKEQILAAGRKGVEIRVVMPANMIGLAAFQALSRNVSVRAADCAQNCLVFDRAEVLILDDRDGRGAIFSSTDILGLSQSSAFEALWQKAMETDVLADMTYEEAQEVCFIINTITSMGLPYVMRFLIQSDGAKSDLYDLLEKNGIALTDKTFDDVLSMIDVIMQITCSGHARMEVGSQSITVESPRNSGGSLPWVSILDRYLQVHGYKTRTIIQNGRTKSDSGDGGEKAHIRLSKN